MKRICIFFDGTWNKRESQTNVFLMRNSILRQASDGVEQQVFYDEGVGTRWYTSILGGLFGHGLSRNIRQGWDYLSRVYEPGDQVYVFGFSRGAYTARSLVGLIRKCGVLRSPSEELIARAYREIYRDRDAHPDGDKAKRFRAEHAQADRTEVQCIGVWDTVGSLGIPGKKFPFSRGYYNWHDTELSSIVRHAFHAVAIDEHRKDFPATMWVKKAKPNQVVDQVWFAGAHAQIGGGYEGDQLQQVALQWMRERAESAGLGVRHDTPDAQAYLAPLEDSHGDFLWGLYKKFSRRRIRRFGTGESESVAPAATARMAEVPEYRPETLKEFWP